MHKVGWFMFNGTFKTDKQATFYNRICNNVNPKAVKLSQCRGLFA